MKKNEDTDDELVAYPHWGSHTPDRTLSATLCKAIGLACIGIPAITVLAVVFDLFLLK